MATGIYNLPGGLKSTRHEDYEFSLHVYPLNIKPNPRQYRCFRARRLKARHGAMKSKRIRNFNLDLLITKNLSRARDYLN